MKRFLLLSVIFAFQKTTSLVKGTEIASVEDRIALLKQQIAVEIEENQRQSEHLRQPDDKQYAPIDKSDDAIENYEYLDNDNMAITPIMDFDDSKENARFKLRKIKATTKSEIREEKEDISEDTKENSRFLRNNKGTHKDIVDGIKEKDRSKLRKIKRTTSTTREVKKDVLRSKTKGKKSKALKPEDIFYRRYHFNKDFVVQPWMLCQDLITPFINGYRTEMKVIKPINAKDTVVTRLIHLLSVNTTGQTKDEIYSIMYQVGSLQLRLFQWDAKALSSLTHFFIKGNPRRFRGLKNGIRQALNKWHLDLSNATNLLKQTKIFRPPCVRISNYDGSTTPLRALVEYSKITTKRICHMDQSGDNCER